MFFIGVFGIEDKQKEVKGINNFNCKVCNIGTSAKLIKKFTCFHVFFIPIFKWNESYYVVCERCNSVYSISNEKGKAIEADDSVQISEWDLEEVYSGSNSGTNICRSCGAEVSGSFKYCPHCGQRIR